MLKLTPLKWFVILALIAIGLALGLPPDPHALSQLHISSTAYRIAILVLLVPYALIWYLSFYAFAKLQEYSRPLKSSKDGIAFRKITIGMAILAFSLIVPTIISLILNYIAVRHSSLKTAVVIINNYIGLFPGLVAFLLLYNGARELVRSLKAKTQRLDLRWHAIWFFVLAVTFSHLTMENQYVHQSYHLTAWLLALTYVVPYLYGWMVGLLSVYDFHLYAKTVEGKLYQQGIKQLANGIAVAVTGSIAIQFVNITIAQRVNKSLAATLLVDYLLLILIAVGLILMALGTKKLKKIEEV
jgi:hypothetical protein